MSSKDKGDELTKEDVQKRVDKMYENYGIDPNSSDDGDLNRVYRFYNDNPRQLDIDFDKSKQHAYKFAEEDAL